MIFLVCQPNFTNKHKELRDKTHAKKENTFPFIDLLKTKRTHDECRNQTNKGNWGQKSDLNLMFWLVEQLS